jgi:hypothetical protein
LLSGLTAAFDPPAELPLLPPMAAFPLELPLVVVDSLPDPPVPASVFDPDVPGVPEEDPTPLAPTPGEAVVPPPAPPLVWASASVELRARQEASAITDIFMSSSFLH